MGCVSGIYRHGGLVPVFVWAVIRCSFRWKPAAYAAEKQCRNCLRKIEAKHRWPGWLGLMERFGLTRSMSAKGCSPDNAAAEGFFGRMKTEAVYPEKWEEHTRNEVLALVDEYIRWHDHERIKQSLGWMSPVQYRQSQGMAA